jgi:hypothetical protein
VQLASGGDSTDDSLAHVNQLLPSPPRVGTAGQWWDVC